MHYIVTGGCGFIGSHLVGKLIGQGHKVTVIDNLSNASTNPIPTSAELIVADITTRGMLDARLSRADGVFHLAAIVSVTQSATQWLRTHQVTLGGTVVLLDAIARSKKPIPVVLASSAAVYGDCADLPLAEGLRCEPLSAYGADKLACEAHARIGSLIHGIPTAALRFFNVYGPGQSPDSPYAGVVSIFADRMARGQGVTIYGDGEQTRDYIYVGDVVDAMTRAMNCLEDKTLTHGVFNICTGTPVSVTQLAHLIASVTGHAASIKNEAARPGEIRHSLGDPSRAVAALGLAPPTALKAGLERTLKNV